MKSETESPIKIHSIKHLSAPHFDRTLIDLKITP